MPTPSESPAPRPDSLRVAALQMNSQGDVAENLAEITRRTAEAAEDGVQLLVLPENFAYFGLDGGRQKVAEVLAARGHIVGTLQELAVRHSLNIIGGGMPEASAEPARPYNTAVVVDAEGHLQTCYRKVHLFDVELSDGTVLKESRSTSPGAGVEVVNLAGVPVGLSICYDIRFPELYRTLMAEGAQLVVVTAAFTVPTGKAHFSPLLRARAIENQTWLLAATQWGEHPGGRTTYGHSQIIDPWGVVVSELSEGTGLVATDVDLLRVDQVRRELPCLQHRRL